MTLRRKTALFALVFLLVLAIGAAYQAISAARDERRFPPPGRLVDIGGYRLHIYCTGEGTPTVILDAARANWSPSWGHVQPEVAKFTRVCSFDRAGLGWSDPGPNPRTAQQMMAELRSLLQKAGIRLPVVLVASSASAYQARLWVSQFPAEIAGLVLVDPVLEGGVSFLTPKESERQRRMIQVARLLAPFGIIRAVDAMGLSPDFERLIEKFPNEIHGVVRAQYYRSRTWRVALDEVAGDEQSKAQVQGIALAPSDQPVVVISALRDIHDESARQQWRQQHADLARKLSVCGTQMIAENSGHLVQLDGPQFVVEAIRRVVVASAGNPPKALTRSQPVARCPAA